MTPYEIKLLLDIYSMPYWFEGRQEPIFVATVNEFVEQGLIGSYVSLINVKITPKGRAHVIQLCNLLYPTEQTFWSDQFGNKIPDTL